MGLMNCQDFLAGKSYHLGNMQEDFKRICLNSYYRYHSQRNVNLMEYTLQYADNNLLKKITGDFLKNNVLSKWNNFVISDPYKSSNDWLQHISSDLFKKIIHDSRLRDVLIKTFQETTFNTDRLWKIWGELEKEHGSNYYTSAMNDLIKELKTQENKKGKYSARYFIPLDKEKSLLIFDQLYFILYADAETFQVEEFNDYLLSHPLLQAQNEELPSLYKLKQLRESAKLPDSIVILSAVLIMGPLVIAGWTITVLGALGIGVLGSLFVLNPGVFLLVIILALPLVGAVPLFCVSVTCNTMARKIDQETSEVLHQIAGPESTPIEDQKLGKKPPHTSFLKNIAVSLFSLFRQDKKSDPTFTEKKASTSMLARFLIGGG